MKLRFLDSGSANAPILVVCDCTTSEIGALMAAASELANGVRDVVDVCSSGSDEVLLRWRVAERDLGIQRTPPRFECALRRTTWGNVEGLLEPLARSSQGFQWLDQSGDVALLCSPDGRW